ncbi:MAG: double zinc ribbon domain-containing protein, partial [Chthoniobacterales bacterium]
MWASGIVKQAVDAAGDLLFPPHCAVCETSVESGRWVCVSCESTVRRIKPPRCENCSHPLDGLSGPFVCPNCKGRLFHFEFAVSVMRAGGTTRE